MLRIVSGAFVDKFYKTLHRGAYYTNDRALDDMVLTMQIGWLLPSTRGYGGLGTLTIEIMERIAWETPQPGVLISTGGEELIRDAAAVVSFALNITCIIDPDLVRRFTKRKDNEANARNAPRKYLRHSCHGTAGRFKTLRRVSHVADRSQTRGLRGSDVRHQTLRHR